MSDARILDQGYRRYDGPRSGPAGSVRSLVWHSMLRALGLRRSFWAKVFPILAVLIAYAPVLFFVATAAFVPSALGGAARVIIPDYPDILEFSYLAIVIFTAFVGPEVLCSDRRDGLLGLYLASPLTRTTYLAAKALATVAVIALVTVGPQVLLVVGLTLVDAGPGNVGDFLVALGRGITAGLAVSIVFAALSLAAAALTDRRAVATAGVILLLFVSSIAIGVGVFVLDITTSLYLADLSTIPFELAHRIFGSDGSTPELGAIELVGANLAWALVLGAAVWTRYNRLTVTR